MRNERENAKAHVSNNQLACPPGDRSRLCWPGEDRPEEVAEEVVRRVESAIRRIGGIDGNDWQALDKSTRRDNLTSLVQVGPLVTEKSSGCPSTV